MGSRSRVPSYAIWSLAFLCLLVPIVLTGQQDNPTPSELRPEERLITVWKVGGPHQGETPDTKIALDLQQSAEKMGLTIIVKAFPAVGFAQTFFDAFEKGQEPDVVAGDNIGIIYGITTPLGEFTGIASDKTVREQLVEVTESLQGLGRPDRYGMKNGWVFLVMSSQHSKAARQLAFRSPVCSQRWKLAQLTQDLQESVIPIVRAYLQGDSKSLAASEDPERLHTDRANPRQFNPSEIKGCGYWGDERLAFVPVVSSYESARAVGQISLLLVLRKQNAQWQLLSASTDPISVSRFPEGVPKLVSLLQEAGTPGANPLPAKLVAPLDGKFPVPADGERFGDFVWQPSTSSDVVAQIIEFAYEDDARLFLEFSSGDSPANDHISDGQLWTTMSLWRWRVWSISNSGAISFSEARSFTH